MPLELRPVLSAAEMPEYISCYLEAFSNPDSPFTHLAAPVYGSDAEAQNDRVLGFSARHWFAHSADPSSRLFKVVDTERNDKIVGGAKWNVYLEDPFKKGVPKASAYWWPPGPSKRYTEAVFNRLLEIRNRRKPHILCYYTFTHPNYRRMGAGNLMMEWATHEADKLSLEIHIEGSPLGSSLYTRHGLRILEIAELNPPPGTQEEEIDE
ncbi:hypothetical protein EV356DRAFT_534641 [Viridothelium virens]|uniref:N-acetyltransferase domain-containing protein n=1 Tax=Viridothelium virens TaxID=1048519 RepID=A0A6A6H3A0_VIRVR|nr:hypothetical protein EV356DRAFT_534641 [Viridothelium virens]